MHELFPKRVQSRWSN